MVTGPSGNPSGSPLVSQPASALGCAVLDHEAAGWGIGFAQISTTANVSTVRAMAKPTPLSCQIERVLLCRPLA